MDDEEIKRLEEVRCYNREYQRKYRQCRRLEKERDKNLASSNHLRDSERIIIKNLERLQLPRKIGAELFQYVQKNLSNDPQLINLVQQLILELDDIHKKFLLQQEAINLVKAIYREKNKTILWEDK